MTEQAALKGSALGWSGPSKELLTTRQPQSNPVIDAECEKLSGIASSSDVKKQNGDAADWSNRSSTHPACVALF
jgi:hypothetical protein